MCIYFSILSALFRKHIVKVVCSDTGTSYWMVQLVIISLSMYFENICHSVMSRSGINHVSYVLLYLLLSSKVSIVRVEKCV